MQAGDRFGRSLSFGGLRRVVALLMLTSALVLAFSGLALAAQLSGTITDHWSGAPIAGVQLTVDVINADETEGTPVVRPETDAAGHWEAQVQTGNYWIYAEAPGYYGLGLGAPVGHPEVQHFTVGDTGLNLASQMVPNNTAFIGLEPTLMRWTNLPKEGFRSMALEMSYSSLVFTPSNWAPSPIVVEIVDRSGRPVWPKSLTREEESRPGEGSGATSGFTAGSAEGCQFFSSIPYKQRPKVEGLKVVSYLKSSPALRVEEAITPDYSGCSQTQLELWNPQIFLGRRIKMMLGATIVDRWPEELKVPGVMRFVVNGHKPIYVHVKNATEPEFTAKASKQIHPGKNKVVASFTPSVDTVTAPASKHLVFKVPRADFRHYR
jgi:hypothetical protein